MSYRRLPNTDSARIRALRSAVEKATDTDFRELLFPISILNEARSVLNRFEQLLFRYRQLYDIQVKNGQSFAQAAEKARMYLSHFVEIVYRCVLRAEIKKQQLAFYGLENSNFVIPDMSTDEELLQWGEKIIRGEYRRLEHRGIPIYNPSIAKVNVMFTLFKEAHQTQQLHQKATMRVSNEVDAYRERVDRIILEIWREVEKHNTDLPVEKMLAENRKYGIVYSREGEIVEWNFMDSHDAFVNNRKE